MAATETRLLLLGAVCSSSRSTATRSGASCCPGRSRTGPTSTPARSTPGWRRWPSRATSTATTWSTAAARWRSTPAPPGSCGVRASCCGRPWRPPTSSPRCRSTRRCRMLPLIERARRSAGSCRAAAQRSTTRPRCDELRAADRRARPAARACALVDLLDAACGQAEREWLLQPARADRARRASRFPGEPMDWQPAADDPGWQMAGDRERYLELLRPRPADAYRRPMSSCRWPWSTGAQRRLITGAGTLTCCVQS